MIFEEKKRKKLKISLATAVLGKTKEIRELQKYTEKRYKLDEASV